MIERSRYRLAILLGIIVALTEFGIDANAQNNDNIPFHEVAHLIINATQGGDITASVTLQSTSTNDIQIGQELASRISADERIAYISLTNEYSCILGVNNQSCIIVSVLRDGEWNDIEAIQTGVREIGDEYIGDLNAIFDTSAEFHSAFIHYSEDARVGLASDRRIVSAVYTMPREDTASMYEKIGGILLSPEIRKGGGFYDMSRRVLSIDGSHMLVSITPIATSQLIQVRVSSESEIKDVYDIDTISLLSSKSIERSKLFSQGSNPLGSIVQITILSPEELVVASTASPILPTRVVDNEHIPLYITNPGWIFDPIMGNIIKAKYIFGGNAVVEDTDLSFTLKTTGAKTPLQSTPIISVQTEAIYAIVAIIIGTGIGIWFLLKRKSK